MPGWELDTCGLHWLRYRDFWPGSDWKGKVNSDGLPRFLNYVRPWMSGNPVQRDHGGELLGLGWQWWNGFFRSGLGLDLWMDPPFLQSSFKGKWWNMIHFLVKGKVLGPALVGMLLPLKPYNEYVRELKQVNVVSQCHTMPHNAICPPPPPKKKAPKNLVAAQQSNFRRRSWTTVKWILSNIALAGAREMNMALYLAFRNFQSFFVEKRTWLKTGKGGQETKKHWILCFFPCRILVSL